jgi:hypothetical protein
LLGLPPLFFAAHEPARPAAMLIVMCSKVYTRAGRRSCSRLAVAQNPMADFEQGL